MNTLKNILTRLFTSFSKVPIPGTITAIGGDKALYPTVIHNEGLGGHHVYDTLEELSQIPISRLQRGMLVTVNQHTNPEGVTVKSTRYRLEVLPPMTYDYIKDIPGYDISQYFKAEIISKDFELAEQVQYSPNCDILSGAATIDGSGGQPPFPSSNKGKKINKVDYDSLVDTAGDVLLSDGSIIKGYWSNTYDSTKNHKWMRTRISSTSDWSIPIRVDGEGYSEGDYIENRFQWSVTQPLTPPMQLNGKLNNEPEGWLDIPGALVANSKLWMIKAQKDVYQQLKTAWMPPIEIKVDPALTRYSERATPNPNNVAYEALEDNGWSSLLDSSIHKFMANRMDVNSQWIITQIGGESGEYIEYKFKAYDMSLIDDILNNPDSYKPRDSFGTGWEDVPYNTDNTKQLFVISALKFYNKELKETWSDPVPFGGQDTVIDVIKSSGGDEFKKDKGGLISPSEITLSAYLYRGVNQVTPTLYNWVRIYNNGLADNTSYGSNSSITIFPNDIDGKAIFKCEQTFEGKVYVEEYSILDIADGKDADSLILTATSQIITKKADGSRLPASGIRLRAMSSNLSDEGSLMWYKRNNPTDSWTQILNGGVPHLSDTYDVVYSDFNTDNEIHYKVESVDGLYDEYTIYELAEATGGAPATLMILSNESHNVILDEATGTIDYTGATTSVKIFEGANDVTGLWTVTKVDQPTIVSSINSTDVSKPVITINSITANTSFVTINASKGGVTISKQFTISRISNPVGSIILDIDSSAGFSFNPLDKAPKTLTANLYIDGTVSTDNSITYTWSVDGVNKGSLKTQTIDIGLVNFSATVKCIAGYKGKNYTRTVTMTDVKDAKGLGILYTTYGSLETETASLGSVHKPTVAYNVSNQTITANDGVTVVWSNNATGAVWMSTRKENDVSWSNPIRIKGEKGFPGPKGNFIKNIFKRASSIPSTPTGNPIPTGWYDIPPSGTTTLWVSYAEVTNEGKTLVGTWSVPSQISGDVGIQGPKGEKGDNGDPTLSSNISSVPGQTNWTSGGNFGKTYVDYFDKTMSTTAGTIKNNFSTKKTVMLIGYAVISRDSSVQDTIKGEIIRNSELYSFANATWRIDASAAMSMNVYAFDTIEPGESKSYTLKYSTTAGGMSRYYGDPNLMIALI